VQLVPAAKVYKGSPALFSRMVPLLVEAAFTVALAEAAPVVAVVPEVAAPELPVLAAVDVVALLGLEDPQAARTRATAAKAATAVPGRARREKPCRAGRPGCLSVASSS
jgi:hypothetical protein